jgi:hypothetical protein
VNIPPEAWALIGTAVTAGPAYLSIRKARRKADDSSEAATGALSTVAERVAEFGAKLDKVAEHVAELRERVAVHDDRFRRPPWFGPALEARSLPTDTEEITP